MHTGRKSTSKEKGQKEKKGKNMQTKNRNLRFHRQLVIPLPPSPVLADIIFLAPSTPTQPLQVNLHPVVTAEKKKELKKKETGKVADSNERPKRIRQSPIRYEAEM